VCKIGKGKEGRLEYLSPVSGGGGKEMTSKFRFAEGIKKEILEVGRFNGGGLRNIRGRLE